MGLWFPEVAQWVWVLSIILFIGALNLCSVKVFGELEFWLSLVKVAAIVAMIVGGAAVMLFGFGQTQHATGISNLWQHGGFMPNGIGGVVASLAVVMFAFGGIEIIGITASEAKDPAKVLPKAINAVPVRILLFYVLTLTVLMAIYPWNSIGQNGSPFVEIFSNLGISSAANVLNVVVITAAISAINSDIFGAGRMMYGMAQDGRAAQLHQTDRRRRAVDDGAGDVDRPAAGGGAQLPDPGESLHDHRLDRHLRHRLGVADDPAVADRHAPHAVAGGNPSAELPGAVVAGGAGIGDRLYGICHRPARLLRREPHRAVRRAGVDRFTHRGLLAVGAQERRRLAGERGNAADVTLASDKTRCGGFLLCQRPPNIPCRSTVSPIAYIPCWP